LLILFRRTSPDIAARRNREEGEAVGGLSRERSDSGRPRRLLIPRSGISPDEPSGEIGKRAKLWIDQLKIDELAEFVNEIIYNQ